ncbi:TPA: indolepyruvate oxidoreductase subunit beta [Candidatus Bathyarchaeota archaeon]|nr:indolepyruvate oxidoreductase subunit beta [Candidatus Bathyarchaeota archaeon]HIJ08495.1 indolepyruvate oxidoreductase subunit beta [Candidatus Bathyarchaeota archaeon]
MKLDVVFSGVGGQGVVVLSDIFCEAALASGYDVAKAEVHGMAQRGGSIIAHARIGDNVQAPLIERGRADVLLGFEMLETARTIHMLKQGGTVVLNAKYLPPNLSYLVDAEPLNYSKILCMIKRNTGRVHEIDAVNMAEKLGNLLVVNTILLGALSALPENPIDRKMFEEAISKRFKEKYIKVNLQAFEFGRKAVTLG